MTLELFIIIVIISVIAAGLIAWGLYSLVYDSNHRKIVLTLDYGNEITQVYELNIGDDFFLDNEPQKEGYNFEGWFLDPEFKKPFTLKEEIKEDTKLYAKWTVA